MFRRQIITKALNYIKKNDILKHIDANKFHSTLTKLPTLILHRQLIDFNLIMINKFSKFIEQLAEKTEFEPEAEIINRYTTLFDDCDIDGWWTRKHMTDLSGMDLIPHPLICQAALRACRRLNDYALAIRFMEMVRFKCGNNTDTYKWINDQMKVVYMELGMESPEDLCYDVPELFLERSHYAIVKTDYDCPPASPAPKKEVPIATKPPPPCQKPTASEIDFDISKKPPPACMKPTDDSTNADKEECEKDTPSKKL